MKILNGSELASFIKERQAHQVRALKSQNIQPKLLIIRDNDNPVITKYVNLKIRYGKDIGIDVEEFNAGSSTITHTPLANTRVGEPSDTQREQAIREKIAQANSDPAISGIIIQLPLTDKSKTDSLCNLIAPEKDVDGLGKNSRFDSATATAINWLLAGYDIDLKSKSLAIVGQGKLVGAPLLRMWQKSQLNVTPFDYGDDLTKLKNFDIIVTATGSPGLILPEMVKPGAVVVDAGVASENGHLRGDLADSVRARQDLAALTPTTGGVGPLTITCLFDHLLQASTKIYP